MKPATCNEHFKPADEPGRHPMSGETRYPVNMYVARNLIRTLPLVPAVFGVVAGSAMLPLMYWINHKWGFDSLRLEVLRLLAWPAGYGIGTLFTWIGSK